MNPSTGLLGLHASSVFVVYVVAGGTDLECVDDDNLIVDDDNLIVPYLGIPNAMVPYHFAQNHGTID
jgi:hypothetical protein